MAGGKKKKKPATNPARGVATTSVASKPKFEVDGGESESNPIVELKEGPQLEGDSTTLVASTAENPTLPQSTLTAEEFEKQLENSELQVLVEKHAQKVKRDAVRQQSRLEIDRRVLRGQAESINTRKWLPTELTDEILELIEAEGRFLGQNVDALSASKNLSEEDLTIRLWTLYLSLLGAGFAEEKVSLALQHVLDISNKVTFGKDTIWGMEDSLDWLARECPRSELPDYDGRQRKTGPRLASQTPADSPLPSGTNTPRFEQDPRYMGLAATNGVGHPQPDRKKEPAMKITTDYDSDIDPDDLLPTYLDCKAKLFQLQQQLKVINKPVRKSKRSTTHTAKTSSPTEDPGFAKILRKIKRIEGDILFDQYLADQKWEPQRIQLEKEAAAARNAVKVNQDHSDSHDSETLVDSEDDVSREAARIGADILAEDSSDDDAALADLFASLPVNEVDPVTGKSSTVVNGSDGVKVTIRDFGNWAGVNPTRILEEACRAR